MSNSARCDESMLESPECPPAMERGASECRHYTPGAGCSAAVVSCAEPITVGFQGTTCIVPDMTPIAPGRGRAGIAGGAPPILPKAAAWLIALVCICVLAAPFDDGCRPERAGSPGARHRHQGRDRLCRRRPADEGAGAGRRPGRAGRDRPARHAGRAPVLHARDDPDDPRLARSGGDVRGAERRPGGQRRHLSPLRVARGRHGAGHASGRRHADPAVRPGHARLAAAVQARPGDRQATASPTRPPSPRARASTMPWPTSARWRS